MRPTKPAPSLPLMQALPHASIPGGKQLILASGSPRRAELLTAAGYDFHVKLPADGAEDNAWPSESPELVVRRLAYQKAADVARRVTDAIVLAADTLAVCDGQLLGKPQNRAHAEQMLRQLSGQSHFVLSGICLWDMPSGRRIVDVVRTDLLMTSLEEPVLQQYLDSLRWQGKAGAFGYQDGNDWLQIIGDGSESNVVGLPMERLAELLTRFDEIATTNPIGRC